jgi:DNA-binding beta-propeller fold protein YncE
VNPEWLIPGLLGEVRGVIQDPATGTLYWTKTTLDGGIFKVEPDGTGLAEVIAPLDTPHDLAIDTVNQRLYWIEGIEDAGTSTVSIRSATLAGMDVQTVHAGLSDRVRGLAIDSTGGKLYWTDVTDDDITRSNLDGNQVETILTGLANPHDVIIDEANADLYWSDGINSTTAATGLIGQADLDGGNPQTVASGLSSRIRDISYAFHRFIPLFEDGFEGAGAP